MAGKAVMVHSLEQARAAVAAAAERGVPVTLHSAEGAAGTVGALWFKALVERATADHRDATVTAVLDCADKPGHVLAALRHGFTQVRFTGRPKARQELLKVAEAHGATLVGGRLQALDLLDEADPEAACRAWLAPPKAAKKARKHQAARALSGDGQPPGKLLASAPSSGRRAASRAPDSKRNSGFTS